MSASISLGILCKQRANRTRVQGLRVESININSTAKQMNKQNGNRLTDKEIRLVVARGDRSWGLGEKGEGIKKYKLIATEYSWGHEVRHREHSQQHCNNYVQYQTGA